MNVSFFGMVNQLNRLSDKSIKSRHLICEINNINYGSIDTRMICFSAIQSVIYSETHIYFMMQNFRNSPVESINLQSTHERVPVEQIDFLLTREMKTLLLVNVCFSIDFSIADLLRYLGKRPSMSVSKNFKDFLDFLKIEKEDKEYYIEVIKVLTFMRNTSHNNGIHRNKNMTSVIKGKSFIFEEGKASKNNDSEMIIILAEEILEILTKVFCAETKENKKSLKLLIPDGFNYEELKNKY